MAKTGKRHLSHVPWGVHNHYRGCGCADRPASYKQVHEEYDNKEMSKDRNRAALVGEVLGETPGSTKLKSDRFLKVI
ncbi:hypothetical protein LINGRAPRIM_LOCUS2707 [Linum grandiflorum]